MTLTYKELKILSARPYKKDYKKIPHHLYGFQNVKKKFSTGHWLKLANKKILDIKKRKRVPILVGGTGLYFKALTEGLVKIPNIPIKFRDKIRNLHKKIGSKKFYSKLIKALPKIKIILYNFEKLSGYKFSAEAVTKLVKNFPNNIIGCKDSSYNLFENLKLPNFLMFPGSEAKLLKGLELGCSGCISAVTNVTHSLARKVFDDFDSF